VVRSNRNCHGPKDSLTHAIEPRSPWRQKIRGSAASILRLKKANRGRAAAAPGRGVRAVKVYVDPVSLEVLGKEEW